MSREELKRLIDDIDYEVTINVEPYKNSKGFIVRIKEDVVCEIHKPKLHKKAFPKWYYEVVKRRDKGESFLKIAKSYGVTYNSAREAYLKVKTHEKKMNDDELYKLLNGSVDAYNALRRKGIRTLEDLINQKENLCEMKRMGKNTLLYIETCLIEHLKESEVMNDR